MLKSTFMHWIAVVKNTLNIKPRPRLLVNGIAIPKLIMMPLLCV